MTLETLLERARGAEPALRNLARRSLAQGVEQLEAAGIIVRLRGEAFSVLADPPGAEGEAEGDEEEDLGGEVPFEVQGADGR